MRIILTEGKNTRTLIVKIRYDLTKPICKKRKDSWGRHEYTIWQEKKTTVSCFEWDTESEPISRTVYTGTTTCHYQDKYDKKYGKMKAWQRCIDEMQKQGFISAFEACVLQDCDLNGSVIRANVDNANVSILKQ